MVFGTPGVDKQEQGQLLLFLRHVHHGLNLQEAIDQPMSHTMHFPSSFYPRDRKPGHLAVETSFGPEVIADLRARAGCLGEDRKSTRLNSSHSCASRMPSSACNKKTYY